MKFVATRICSFVPSFVVCNFRVASTLYLSLSVYIYIYIYMFVRWESWIDGDRSSKKLEAADSLTIL